MPSAGPVYDGAHQAERRRQLEDLVDGDPCCRCGGPMYRADARNLDLDHDDHDTTRYLGLAHRGCNRTAGAIKGNRMRGFARHVQRDASDDDWHSRDW